MDKIVVGVVRPAKMASDSICATAEKALRDTKYVDVCEKEKLNDTRKVGRKEGKVEEEFSRI